MRLFIDMDGVLADFIGGLCDWYGVLNPYLQEKNKGEWDIVKLLNRKETERDFWEELGLNFWANLPKTPEADGLVRLLKDRYGLENLCILSRPCMTPGCLEGKFQWIKEHFPDFQRRFLFGTVKDMVARHDTLLIDDYPKNVKAFARAGGSAILMPRPWNFLYKNLQPLEYVEQHLDHPWTFEHFTQVANIAAGLDFSNTPTNERMTSGL